MNKKTARATQRLVLHYSIYHNCEEIMIEEHPEGFI